MEHVSLAGLDVTRLRSGCMGMSGYDMSGGTDDAESIRTIHRALDLGVTDNLRISLEAPAQVALAWVL
jgi:aryl-alcohol dehydrogenase-like predicted oxidoreductase